MILMAVHIVKVFLPLAALTCVLFLLRRKLNQKELACIAFFIAAFVLAANAAAELVPPLTDTVTLTALGEKSESAQGTEIVINGFEIDEEKYLVDQIREGKWFWRGDQYMWRPETDIRQPEGTTRTVTLGVPAGWSRSILFSANEWRGIAEISTGGTAQTIDTAKIASFELGRSDTTLLILNYVRILAVYSAVFLIGSVVLFFGVHKYLKAKTKSGEGKIGLEETRFRIILLMICMAAFAAIIEFSVPRSLWRDEIAMVGYVTNTNSIFEAMKTDLNWLPIWKGLMFLWYRIVPYGERWLRLLPELCYIPGIYYVGLCGKRVANERVGIVAAILAATNARLISRAAADITCYSFLSMLSAILLYLYVGRFQSEQTCSWRKLIPITTAMVLIAYTHYFGFFLCGAMFLVDCVLCQQKMISRRYLLPYLFGGILYSPWLCYVIFSGHLTSSYWQPSPTLNSILIFINALSGNIPVRYYILLFGLIMLPVTAILCRGALKKHIVTFLMIILPSILFVCVFLYGRFIAIGNTFWVWSYFTVIVPCFTILTAITFEMIFTALVEHGQLRMRIIAYSLFALTLLHSTVVSYQKVKKGEFNSADRYRETAAWLCATEYLYTPSTLILVEVYASNVAPMVEYYITRQGTRREKEELNIRPYNAVKREELLLYDRVVTIKPIDEKFDGEDQLHKWLEDSYSLIQHVEGPRAYVYEKK